MDHLDDLPKYDKNHETQEIAETEFRAAISDCGCFLIQQEDRRDYGTDFQLEVKNNGDMTNVRIHVQMKGTNSPELDDGSVSRSVARKNINYLLQQPCSIYVCFHEPTKRLLVRYAEDVYREYEHQGNSWRGQKSITVNFSQLFDAKFQNSLKSKSSAIARLSRNDRVLFSITPPDHISKVLSKTAEKAIVPPGYEQAKAMLNSLYDLGKDEVISNSFDQFYAELKSFPQDVIPAYMAEINIGINGGEVSESRIRKGMEEIKKVISLECYDLGSLLYSMGNGWLALEEFEKAIDLYNSALVELGRPELSDIAAQCYKNMGAVMERLNKGDSTSIMLYQRALDLSPQLSEAHFALALCYRRKQDFSKVLEHLDQVILINRPEKHNLSLQGWRIEALFYNEDYNGAFREINSLVIHADKSSWIWSWCARQVMIFGRDSLHSVQKAAKFWNLYLQEHPEDIIAKQERLLCLWCIKSTGKEVEINYGSFKKQAIEIIDSGEVDIALWWDKVGHWAQYDKDWIEAEACYREAYKLEPGQYGYCLGTALNFLGEYEKAYPILLEQAENHFQDAMSWFQVAVACEGVEDISGCLFAYHKAVKLDPQYELAWFNLGGIYWNLGDIEKAKKVWEEAIRLFPSHELTAQLSRYILTLFSKEPGVD